MMNNRYLSLTMLLLMIGIVAASESYLDYGGIFQHRSFSWKTQFFLFVPSYRRI